MRYQAFEGRSTSMEPPLRNVLLAEDNDDEYVLFVQAISGLSDDLNVMRLHHGYNLLSMLQTDIHADAIFLDINMPYKNGLLILKEIREMEKFANIPIVILSSSDYVLTVRQAYQLKATFFASKTDDFKKLQQILKRIFDSTYFKAKTQPPFEEFYISG